MRKNNEKHVQTQLAFDWCVARKRQFSNIYTNQQLVKLERKVIRFYMRSYDCPKIWSAILKGLPTVLTEKEIVNSVLCYSKMIRQFYVVINSRAKKKKNILCGPGYLNNNHDHTKCFLHIKKCINLLDSTFYQIKNNYV